MTKIARRAALLALAFTCLCANAPAQAVDRMQGAATPPVNASHVTIRINGSPEWWPEGSKQLIRRVQSIGEVTSWLLPGDPELKGVDAAVPPVETGQWAYITLTLTTSANGLATGCVAKAVIERDSAPTPALATLGEKLCRRIGPRARFSPALDDDGKPTGSTFELRLALHHDMQDGPSPTIGRMISPPAITPPVLSEKTEWPPSQRWLRLYASRPEFSADMPITTLAALPDHAPLAGIILAGPDTEQPFCELILKSGTPAVDDKACDFAARKIRPVWKDPVPSMPAVTDWQRHYEAMSHHVPMIITRYRGRLAAIPPHLGGDEAPSLSPAALADLVTRVTARWPDGSRESLLAARLDLGISPTGKVTHCHIYDSTGSDAGDAAYCRTLRDDVTFDLARDPFGMPRAEERNIWFSLPAGR